MARETEHTGHCLCGAVSYVVSAPLGNVGACHCSQCRRQTGHYWASGDVPVAAVTIDGADEITWYRSSADVRRGFCRICGSFLFWWRDGSASLEIGAGTLDQPTGLKLEYHIFVGDKGDYYLIGDGLPQHLAEKVD